MRSVNTVGDFALNYSGQFYVGYHLGPYVSLKAAIEYETLNENKYGSYVVDFMGVEKQFTALWQYRYNLLNIKLAYMLNLSNVYQKYDLYRKFNLFVEGGALYSKCMSDNARIYSGELEVGSSPVLCPPRTLAEHLHCCSVPWRNTVSTTNGACYSNRKSIIT